MLMPAATAAAPRPLLGPSMLQFYCSVTRCDHLAQQSASVAWHDLHLHKHKQYAASHVHGMFIMSMALQVDDLRKENQTLLQIIAQLQTASLDSISTGGAPLPAAAAGLGGITSGSTLVPLLGGGAGGEGEGPPGGTASCLSAGAPHDSIDSGPSGGEEIIGREGGRGVGGVGAAAQEEGGPREGPCRASGRGVMQDGAWVRGLCRVRAGGLCRMAPVVAACVRVEL